MIPLQREVRSVEVEADMNPLDQELDKELLHEELEEEDLEEEEEEEEVQAVAVVPDMAELGETHPDNASASPFKRLILHHKGVNS